MLRKATRPFRRFASIAPQINSFRRGYARWRRSKVWPVHPGTQTPPASSENDLEKFFAVRTEGHGIWKWQHYLEIYDRHFSRFRGTDVHIVEIGIYSGGSLEMWRDYFGPKARIFGVDIQPACKAFESDAIKVFIGDQQDRNFWKGFKAEVPRVDIVIDDGGHQAEQQIVTCEELLPHMRPGGVYLCEDLHHTSNRFAGYIYGFASNLNASHGWKQDFDHPEQRVVCTATAFQSAVRSVHLYPLVTVIEKNLAPIGELISLKHGTVWAPFSKKNHSG